jgi:hypothetical protein
MKYEALEPIGLHDAKASMASGDPSRIADALVRASLSDIDAKWVEAACLGSLDLRDLQVRWSALTALGHLARRYRNLDVAATLKAIQPVRDHPSLAGKVEDLLDDIEVFIIRQSRDALRQ